MPQPARHRGASVCVSGSFILLSLHAPEGTGPGPSWGRCCSGPRPPQWAAGTRAHPPSQGAPPCPAQGFLRGGLRSKWHSWWSTPASQMGPELGPNPGSASV
uniref:Uncharacterized protein n=1 Tax=Mustela putorius furo TaxID=9669 RepID=M3Z2G0_MUSPF